MIELDNGKLSIFINKVIYNGREYDAPISFVELIYCDIVFEFFEERKIIANNIGKIIPEQL